MPASRARHRNWQTTKTREKIRCTMLVNRLQDHAEGKIEMTATQVKAAAVLLAKTIPDLTSADIHDSRQELNISETLDLLVKTLGRETVARIYPDLGKYLPSEDISGGTVSGNVSRVDDGEDHPCIIPYDDSSSGDCGAGDDRDVCLSSPSSPAETTPVSPINTLTH